MLRGLSYIHCPLRLHQHHDTLVPPTTPLRARGLIQKYARPYREPRRLLDIFGGDGQEQEGSESGHQQRDGDDRMSGAMSHEVEVRGAALLGKSGSKVSVGSPAGRM